jgi:hypothetical protein
MGNLMRFFVAFLFFNVAKLLRKTDCSYKEESCRINMV